MQENYRLYTRHCSIKHKCKLRVLIRDHGDTTLLKHFVSSIVSCWFVSSIFLSIGFQKTSLPAAPPLFIYTSCLMWFWFCFLNLVLNSPYTRPWRVTPGAHRISEVAIRPPNCSCFIFHVLFFYIFLSLDLAQIQIRWWSAHSWVTTCLNSRENIMEINLSGIRLTPFDTFENLLIPYGHNSHLPCFDKNVYFFWNARPWANKMRIAEPVAIGTRGVNCQWALRDKHVRITNRVHQGKGAAVLRTGICSTGTKPTSPGRQSCSNGESNDRPLLASRKAPRTH